MKIAIVDDEKIYREEIGSKILNICDRLNQNVELRIFSDGESLINSTFLLEMEVVLLDIEMPEIDGFNLAKLIKSMNRDIIIVFVSNSPNKVFSSLKFSPFRFIRKSEMAEEMDELIESITVAYKEKYKAICLETKNETLKIEINQIVYFEVLGHEVFCHTINQEISIKGSLNDIVKRMSKYGFIKTHNSYLVNMDYIYSIEKSNVKLIEDYGSIPLARPRINDTKEKFMKFMR